MKRLALILLACAACKSNDKPAAPPTGDDVAQQAPARHAPVARAMPALPPSDVEGSDRPPPLVGDEVRHHRRHWGSDDGSGMTDAQRDERRQQRLQAMHDRFDTNGDGKLSPEELANAPGRFHFDNPEALDTNHDGDISVDELQAAMNARRDAWRAQRAAQQAGQGSAAPGPNDPSAQPAQGAQ